MKIHCKSLCLMQCGGARRKTISQVILGLDKKSSGFPTGLCPDPLTRWRDRKYSVLHNTWGTHRALGSSCQHSPQTYQWYCLQSVPLMQHTAVLPPYSCPLLGVPPDTKLPQTCFILKIKKPWHSGAFTFKRFQTEPSLFALDSASLSSLNSCLSQTCILSLSWSTFNSWGICRS